MPTDANNPHADSETSPTRSVHHDVLVINPNRELYRFNVRKTDVGRVGEYLSVDYLGAGAPGHRKVMHIARKGTPQQARGAAFATLPVKEEPTSSYVCCYLINSENINYRNVWTQAEWNDAPDQDDDGEPFHQAIDRDIQLLIAEHGGRVLYLNIPKAMLRDAKPGWVLTAVAQSPAGTTPHLSAISLEQNPEVWNLLRNGCVAGSAGYASPKADGETTRIPLVNVTSLIPCREQDHGRRGEAGDKQITGTLDFKWPRRPGRPDADLVVAFLPTRGAYRIGQRKLFQLFESYAREWGLDRLGLSVRFETEVPFDPYDPVDYDILVSLQPLDEAVYDELGRRVTIPQSELGNYARRVDRGAATLYAGMPPGLKATDGTAMKSEDYPSSSAFKHFVVHEFGHALGLLHLHQNADLNAAAMAQLRVELGVAEGDDQALDRKVKDVILNELGIAVPDDYVEEAVRGTWPGSKEFSEWPTSSPGDAAQRLGKWLSEPSVLCGLAAHARGEMAGVRPDQYLTVPSESDLGWLRQIYPPRAGDQT